MALTTTASWKKARSTPTADQQASLREQGIDALPRIDK
jgi:hypothetical protein